jgi:hypothetical protein
MFRHRKGKGGRRPDWEEFVDAMAQLLVQHDLNLRDLWGATMHTYQIASTSAVVAAMQEAGRRYAALTRGSSPSEHGQGPPDGHKFEAMMNALAAALVGSTMTEEDKTRIGEALQGLYDKTCRLQAILPQRVRYCRNRECYRRSNTRIMLHLSSPEDELVLHETLLGIGAVYLPGAPPPGQLVSTVRSWLGHY